MQFREISDSHSIHTPELKERDQHSGSSMYNHHYICYEGDIELAFVSLELWPVDNPFVLYELFVARKERNKGIGTSILQEIEKIAKAKGYSRIVLTPKPIDKNYDNCTQQQIVRWYEKRGYSRDLEFARRFEKHLY